MPDRNRFQYVLDISDQSIIFIPRHRKGALVRADISINLEAMAKLMISAYEGTIDYDNGSIQDALWEVQSFLDGRDVQPLLHCSWLLFVDGTVASACLVGLWADKQIPLIAYIMTAGEWKNQGFSKIVLSESLKCLSSDGFSQVAAFITEGNIPSEKLFTGFGFIGDKSLIRQEAISVE